MDQGSYMIRMPLRYSPTHLEHGELSNERQSKSRTHESLNPSVYELLTKEPSHLPKWIHLRLYTLGTRRFPANARCSTTFLSKVLSNVSRRMNNEAISSCIPKCFSIYAPLVNTIRM